MMGVGKTTLGKIVSKMADLKFIDTDANIEENCLMKVIGLVESPIKGPKGNKEFLIYCQNYKNLKQ